MSEVLPCADFMLNVSIESGAKLLDSLDLDILFAVMCDCGLNIFHGCVYVRAVVYVEVC